MKIFYKNYTIDLFDDPNYILGSREILNSYGIEYCEEIRKMDETYPVSKHGIKIIQFEKEIASALICEPGGVTVIHNNAFSLTLDSILICCSDKIYSLSIPELHLNWKKSFDQTICFAIYPFFGDFLIHGELTITRIDRFGNEIWNFTGRDIWVNPDGKQSIYLNGDLIILKDWMGNEYRLDLNGQLLN